MTERLRAVVQAAEQLSPAGLAAVDFSVFADLPDDAVDVLDRMRHEVPPTPPYEEP